MSFKENITNYRKKFIKSFPEKENIQAFLNRTYTFDKYITLASTSMREAHELSKPLEQMRAISGKTTLLEWHSLSANDACHARSYCQVTGGER